MKTLVILLASLFVSAGATFALKSNESNSLVKFTQPKDTTGKHQLIQRARERGGVRVMITYKMDFTGERDLSEGQRLNQRQHISDLHQELTQEIERRNLNVDLGRKIQTVPQIFMTVDEEALEFLYSSPLIKSISRTGHGTTY